MTPDSQRAETALRNEIGPHISAVGERHARVCYLWDGHTAEKREGAGSVGFGSNACLFPLPFEFQRVTVAIAPSVASTSSEPKVG
jgi:hypothetical protein